MKRFLAPILIFAFALPAFAAETDFLELPIMHRMMVLALQLGAVVYAAKLGGFLFERMRMPAVIG